MANEFPNDVLGVVIHPDRLKQLLKIEAAYNNLDEPVNAHTKNKTLNSVEEDLDKVDVGEIVNEVVPIDHKPTHTIDDKPYLKLADSKIKMGGVLNKMLAHPKMGPALKAALTEDDIKALSSAWLPVVVYKTLYHNPDGEIWTRMKDDFESRAKVV